MAIKVLIVDDEQDIIMATAFRLRKSGYDVITAASGEEALKVIGESLPDIIFLDLALPDINGVEVCRCVKSENASKAIPVILFTANADLIEEKAREACADDFLIKPFDARTLIDKIRRFTHTDQP